VQRGIAEFLEHTGQYVTNDASRNAALAAERERCANEIMKYAHNAAGLGPEDYAELVRALGD
jgi:hypothetical protein